MIFVKEKPVVEANGIRGVGDSSTTSWSTIKLKRMWVMNGGEEEPLYPLH